MNNTMIRKTFILALIAHACLFLEAQTPRPIKQFLRAPFMKGASFSLLVKDTDSGRTIFAYDTLRQLTPASVMKVVTTATALEILGEEYRYTTTLEYDGTLRDSVLDGNLYIRGGGDPSLGSAYITAERRDFTGDWISAIRKAGIREITGAVIADESLFDTEGISMKWVNEDLGSYYGAGCYALSVFDNRYDLWLRSGAPGTRPSVVKIEPASLDIRFHNYLTARTVPYDSAYIIGAPFSRERYLYGSLPANRERVRLRGDIPDPPLFLADYLTRKLKRAGIAVKEKPSCFRLSREAGEWHPGEKTIIHETKSPDLWEIIRITNDVSHNLFADALVKTIGTRYTPREGEVVSSFERGIRVLRSYWEGKGLDVSTVWMYDGSGLAVTDKLSTAFVTDLLLYMRNGSKHAKRFSTALPQAGVEGSVRNFLKGTALQGKARLKSGSMSRVKGYAGYIENGGRSYVIALFVNNYDCEGSRMNQELERLLLRLFATEER